jgi:hypothetical protein
MTTPSAYPLAWPGGYPRTERPQASKFNVTLHKAMTDLEGALRLFGSDTGKKVSDVIISSNVTLGQSRPADPGVAVYFTWDGEQRCIAVDRYTKVEDNVRAIYYVLEARRTEMRHGGLTIVRAAFKGFTALPAPEDWRTVLGLTGQNVTPDEIKRVYRQLAKSAHPDSGGSEAAMARLTAARDAALSAVGQYHE